MTDWIDREKQKRVNGINTPLFQSEHAAINARYPGTTLEYCCKCGDPTGRAGKGEDSLYTENDEGPFCWECFSELTTSWEDMPPIPTPPEIETKCVELDPEAWEDSQAMMHAALGTGPQAGKRSWEYYNLPPKKETP